jgi:sec-independent protein translocase protein TatB
VFDIGVSEILVIAVVALIVVGPDEFPRLVRGAGRWIGKVRRYVSELRNEFEREVTRAEELKRALEKQADIADMHRAIADSTPSVTARKESDRVADDAAAHGNVSDRSAEGADGERSDGKS